MTTGWRWVLIPAVVLAVAVVGVLGFDRWTVRQNRDIAIPPDDASPEEVVRTYLGAVDAHDCDTAADLWKSQSAASTWCDDVASLAKVKVGEAFPDDPASRTSGPDQEVVKVTVWFDLHRRPLDLDVSTDDGYRVWGYRLERDDPSDPWRIVDQGVS